MKSISFRLFVKCGKIDNFKNPATVPTVTPGKIPEKGGEEL
jgi:hypothetical protein